MKRTVVLTGILLLGAGVALAQKPQEQVDKTQLAMKSNLKSAIVLSDIVKDKKPYDQAAVDKALAVLDDVAKRFPSLFPESIKGLKPTKGEYYASDKVWTEQAGFRGALCDLRESCRSGQGQDQGREQPEGGISRTQQGVLGLPRKIPRQGLTAQLSNCSKIKGANACGIRPFLVSAWRSSSPSLARVVRRYFVTWPRISPPGLAAV